MFFLENRRDLLHLIRRKAHTKLSTEEKTKTGARKTPNVPLPALPAPPPASSAPLAASPVDSSLLKASDEVLTQLVGHKAARNEIERRIRALEKQQARISDLELKQVQLQSDNALLTQMLVETRKKQSKLQEKMEKILMMLYSVFSNTPLSRVLSGDAWVMLSFMCC